MPKTSGHSILKSGGLKALVLFLLACNPGCFSSRHFAADKTVLKINDTEISTKDFAERLARKLKDFDSLGAKDENNLKRAKQETVQSFLMEAIISNYCKANKIELSKAELEEEINKIRSKYPNDLAFRRALAQENVSMEKWRKELQFTLLQKKAFSHLTTKLPQPNEQELQKYYEANRAQFEKPGRVWLRQIVLDKEDNARRVLAELTKGADFASLAKQFSIAPEGANGGETGWIEKGVLDVFDSAFKMPIGTRSKIIKSPYGYHIFEVVKKDAEGRLSFPEAKDRIRVLIMERREQEAFSVWLEQEIRKSSVFRNDDLINAIRVVTRGT